MHAPLRRTLIIVIALVVASAIPVIDLTPSAAAQEDLSFGSVAVDTWSPEADSDGFQASSVGEDWHRSAPVDAAGVLLVGADWGGDDATRVQVRSRTGDAWSAWVDMPHAHDHGPDEGREAASTLSDPVWTGPVDAIQLRTTAASPDDVDVVAVSADGEGTPLAATGRVTAADAEAATSTPDITTRAEWGANESWRNGEPEYASDVRFAVVHHTAGTNDYAPSQSASIVRSIYSYHTNGRGWDDIGYNFLVDQYGQVFEGRAGGMTEAVMGAHAGGFNSGSTGIAVMGNFESFSTPPAAVDALTDLLAWKLDVHHVDPQGTTEEVAGSSTRFEEGSDVTLPTIIGHRDTSYTSCPGARLHARIQNGSLAADVAATGRPKLYTDAPRSTTSAQQAGTQVEITPSERVTWTLRVRDVDGALVHESRGTASGTFTAAWDHTTTSGQLADPGTYAFEVSARAGTASARPVGINLYVADQGPVGDPDADPTPPPPGAVLLSGDWDGDGTDTPGWYKDGTWGLHDRAHAQGNTTILQYGGQEGDIPVTGDWNGDGTDTIGVVRGNKFILRYEYRSGADIVLRYGRDDDTPVVGDWNGDGTDTLGVVRGNTFILRYEYRSGADIVLNYGRDDDTPVIGDWNGDGTDTLGVVRGNKFILRYEYRSGADIVLNYGRDTDTPVIGDWNADGTDTLGVVRENRWFLRYVYRSGADYVFDY